MRTPVQNLVGNELEMRAQAMFEYWTVQSPVIRG
jgi:hypothetical protein